MISGPPHGSNTKCRLYATGTNNTEQYISDYTLYRYISNWTWTLFIATLSSSLDPWNGFMYNMYGSLLIIIFDIFASSQILFNIIMCSFLKSRSIELK